ILITIGCLGTIFAQSLNKAPCLSEGIIEPEQGTFKTTYTARVHYYDIDGRKPSVIKVVINDLEHVLKRKSGKANNGVYEAKLRLPYGVHKYYFYAEDDNGLPARYPQYGYLTGPVVTSYKSYTKPAKLYRGSVYQEQGTEQTVFTYSVYYFDEYQKPPKAIFAVIDGIEYSMKLHKGEAHNGLYIVQITNLSPSSHAYYFKAIDNNNNCIRLPKYGFIRGPEVSETKNRPPKLFEARLNPEIGYQSDRYSYEITYLDEDRDFPSIINIVINEIAYPMKLKKGKPYNGIYTFTTKHYPGNYHTYYFYCEDGRGGCFRLPAKGYFYGPIVVK
ncbi:MAG: hypothetical protein NZ601_05795, partial [candidate division WOR-3 bacterium]|nr:hypothetical protein [candidate division WOR-3 bacterium]